MQLKYFFRDLMLKPLILIVFSSAQMAQAGMIDLIDFGETSTTGTHTKPGSTLGNPVSAKVVPGSTELSQTGNGIIDLTDNPRHKLSLIFGKTIFKSSNFGFKLAYPQLNLLDNIFPVASSTDLLVSSADEITLYSPATQACCDTDNWQFYTSSQTKMTGSQTAESTKTADIPEPGPLLLVGVGLLAAWVFSRRKKIVLNIDEFMKEKVIK